jgi:hypothetical protein
MIKGYAARVLLCGLLLCGSFTPSLAAAGRDGAYIEVVRRYADTMIERGRDNFGLVKSGLLLSALERGTLSPLTIRPAPPAGIRRGDRSGQPWSAMNGANPQLDQNLLRIFYTLTQITSDSKYAKVADEEIGWFLKNTLSPKTDLLPWGEHLSWDCVADKPISGGDEAMHEFARPWVLWDRCYEIAPRESKRFALGLWNHQIANQKTGGFDRHAPYFEHGPVDGKDFPRHAGFYILTWGHAYKHTQDATYLTAIEALLARFERKRTQKDGTQVGTIGPLDPHSASLLVPQPLAGRLKAFAEKEDELIIPDLRKLQGPLWQTGYSAGTAASTAMFCLGRYEQTQSPAYRELIIAIADRYKDSVPEEDLDAWPMPFGHAISTQLAAYRLANDQKYLDQAKRIANLAIQLFWQDNPLPRASLKTGHYESITGPDTLALSLLELHAVINKLSIPIPSNTIDR